MTTQEDQQRSGRFARLHRRMHAHPVGSVVTKVVVTTIGTVIILAGVVMLVVPGPGLVAIAVGLGVLATEWAWAERWVRTVREHARRAAERTRQMDPAVRRRRLLLGGGTVVVVAAALLAYLMVYDWPGYAVDAWQTAQDLLPVLPELPGM